MAKGLGRIRWLDLGVLRIIKQGKYPYAEMGWSSSLRENEPCISIAYPGCLTEKKRVVRFGYVGKLEVGKSGKMVTTCLMEPGDSGGPVFDLMGRVIGVHSTIFLSLEDNLEAPINNFRKYWTALQQPINYSELPAEDSIPIDMAADKLPRIDTKQILKLIAEQEEKLDQYCIELTSISDKDTNTAFGTLIDISTFPVDHGLKKYTYIISKSSLVGEAPTALVKGKKRALIIMGRDLKKDLVLLQLEQKSKDAIALKKVAVMDMIPAGSLLLSPSSQDEGEASVLGTGMMDLPAIASAGFLGIRIEAHGGRQLVVQVVPNSAASDAMLQTGDEIISINGVKIDDHDSFSKELKKNLATEYISLVRSRQTVVDTLGIVLGRRPQVTGHDFLEKFTGGKSDRRDGFNQIFIHDGKIKPAKCGGPIFDLYNNFIGINLARLSRTSSVGMPVSELVKFIEEIIKSHAIHT